jgi:hypothetical protein
MRKRRQIVGMIEDGCNDPRGDGSGIVIFDTLSDMFVHRTLTISARISS